MKRMKFFCAGKDTLNRFFALVIDLFVFWCVSEIFGLLHVVRPNVAGYYLLTIPAVCAALTHRTLLTDIRVTLVLSVSIPICRAVFQNLVIRT